MTAQIIPFRPRAPKPIVDQDALSAYVRRIEELRIAKRSNEELYPGEFEAIGYVPPTKG